MQIPIKTDENAFEEVTSTRIILGRLVEMRRIKKCPKEIYRDSWNLTSPVYRVRFFVLFCFSFLRRYRLKQESVRPRWPYDMRPSVRAEKYIRDASG